MADRKQTGGAAPQSSPQPSDLVEGVKSTASKLADKAQETARGAASSLASSAEEKARALAEDKKREAAEQVDAAAKFADSIAAEVERALPPAGGYVRGVASGIHGFSAALKDSSVDELMDEARRFAQARPATVLAGALVAGFGLARFLKASADRREGAHARRALCPQARAARDDRRLVRAGISVGCRRRRAGGAAARADVRGASLREQLRWPITIRPTSRRSRPRSRRRGRASPVPSTSSPIRRPTKP